MTLEEFAKRAGVTVHSCDPEWGGKFGYKTTEHPNCRFNGYRSEKAAIDGWLKDKFGNDTAKALLALLKATRPSRVEIREAM